MLADGRKYLVGNRFTVADIAFAVSGASMVLPLGYGGIAGQTEVIPALEDWPEELQAVIRATRETPAGQFILRMYAEERYKSPRTSE